MNSLTGRKVARTGGTPGVTAGIHIYSTADDNESSRLVDLPGYGFAKRSKQERAKWRKLVQSYFSIRRRIVLGMILDIRHAPTPLDLEVLELMASMGFWRRIAIATKADKLSRSRQLIRRREISKQTGIVLQDVFLFSATRRLGVDELKKAVNAFEIEIPA